MIFPNPFINFCATGKSGLGHIRRITNIAAELRRVHPGIGLRLLCNAPLAGVQRDEWNLYDEICIFDRSVMAERMPDCAVIVVDTAKLPGLEKQSQPLCMILRQTQSNRISMFELNQNRPWDLILVPNPSDVWTPDMAKLRRRKTVHVGWIYRQLNDDRNLVSRRLTPARRLLIASGGGGSGPKWLQFRQDIATLIARVRGRCSFPLVVDQCIGPRADLDSRIEGIDRSIQPGANLPGEFARSDLVITTAGYNSVLELATLDVPVLLFPIETRYDDQHQRIEYWSESLGIKHRSSDLQGSVRWIVETLRTRRRRRPLDIGPSGAADAATRIAQLIDRANLN